MYKLLHIHAIIIRSELNKGVFEVSHFLEFFFHESLDVILLRLKVKIIEFLPDKRPVQRRICYQVYDVLTVDSLTMMVLVRRTRLSRQIWTTAEGKKRKTHYSLLAWKIVLKKWKFTSKEHQAAINPSFLFVACSHFSLPECCIWRLYRNSRLASPAASGSPGPNVGAFD